MNFLRIFLNELSYKYSDVSIAQFLRNPNHNNLFGVSQFLSSIGILNQGCRINTISDFYDIKYPAISIKDNKFIVIKGITGEVVSYTDGENAYFDSLSGFYKNWDGAFLEVTKILQDKETNYQFNVKQQLIQEVSKNLLYLLVPVLLMYIGYRGGFWRNTDSIILFFINCSGLLAAVFSYMELAQLGNKSIQKICQILPNSDCKRNILDSSSMLFNNFHLSELALSFYGTNILSILVFDVNIYIFLIYSIISIPICVWSLLYQKFILKNWCILCLFIVADLLFMAMYFAINVFYSWKSVCVIEHNFVEIIIVGISYVIGTITMNYITKFRNTYLKYKYDSKELSDIKEKKDVFEFLLSQEKRLNNRAPNPLVFGNKDSKLILTIVSNPFCLSCIANHSDLKKIINLGFRIEYVFASFSEELIGINANIMAYYRKFGPEKCWSMLSKWFINKEKNVEFFSPYQLQPELFVNLIREQFEWISNENIDSTPSNFLNGNRIPVVYKISDLANWALSSD